MTRRGRVFAMTMAWLAMVPATALGVHLRGTILHVGFRGSSSNEPEKGSHYYRVGEWTPILVELTNDDGDRFEGRLEVRQADRDGDEVVARRDVVVQGTRQFFLYVPGGRFDRPEQFCVWVFTTGGEFAELHDDAGKPITELHPPKTMLPVPGEARVVLDISAQPLNQLDTLGRDENLAQSLVVVRSSPREVPDEVAGLDMADTIVWDGADPKEIDLPQRSALMQWVGFGGTLVLGVSRNWDRLAEGKFGQMLPARLRGTTLMAEAPEWLGAMLGVDAFDTSAGRLEPPLTYCPVTRADLASDATAVVPAAGEAVVGSSPASRHLLVTRRPVGRGQVILVAAELHDLLDHGPRKAAMLRDLLGVRINPTPEKKQQGGGWFLSKDLFAPVQQQTGFKVTGSLYFLIAFTFVVVYIAGATAGGWWWLRRKSALQHTWNLFAATALVGSLVSVLAVQWIRGFTYRVAELTVIDARAGSEAAVATSYLGLKSPTHSRLSLRVPAVWRAPEEAGDMPCLLRPLPPSSDGENIYFAAERYDAVSTLGELRGVPLRATLKQFQASWCGRLPGRLDASLGYVRAGSIELNPGSWLQNNLSTDLYNCYVMVTGQNVQSNRAHREMAIEVYLVGGLPRGQRITWQNLIDRADAFAKANASTGQTQAELRAEALKVQLAQLAEKDWLHNLVPRSQIQTGAEESLGIRRLEELFAKALLLLSLYEEVDVQRALAEGSEVHRSCGLDLDRSHYLLPQTALFVGFSRDPGPLRLCYRKSDRGQWTPIAPSYADVMYRIAIPVRQP